jgi:hypothetical protein
LKRQKKDKSRRRHPVTMVESVMVICVLFLFFFGLLQIMELLYSFICCQYSAYYASRGVALGYKKSMIWRAARVAAISVSGPMTNNNVSAKRYSDLSYAKEYMLYGEDSNTWYQFWGPNKIGTQLKIDPSVNRNNDPHEVTATVYLENTHLLHKGLEFLLGVAWDFKKDPCGQVRTIDYSHYLKEE